MNRDERDLALRNIIQNSLGEFHGTVLTPYRLSEIAIRISESLIDYLDKNDVEQDK